MTPRAAPGAPAGTLAAVRRVIPSFIVLPSRYAFMSAVAPSATPTTRMVRFMWLDEIATTCRTV
jgi:hypothetical protein